MSADTIAPAPVPNYRDVVAAEVRAAMARRRKSGRELAEATGKSQPYWSRRLTGGVAFDVDDLWTVADYLEVSVVSFFRYDGANSYYHVTPGGTGRCGPSGDRAAWELAA